jgi:hypothetical protein
MDMGGMDMGKPGDKTPGSAAGMPSMDMSPPGGSGAAAMPDMDMSQPGAMDHSQHLHAGSASGGNAAAMPGMPGM